MSDKFAFGRTLTPRMFLVVITLLVVLALVLLSLHGVLSEAASESKNRYRLSRELIVHKEDYLKTYGGAVEMFRMPESSSLLPSNAWIKSVQERVAARDLSLVELKPARQKASGGEGLRLIVEGKIQELLGFFYDLAEAGP